jgi:succinoglycan biosynthesis transport protein ExoP
MSGLVDARRPASEAFRALRLTLEMLPGRRTDRAVLLTSPTGGDGTSTIAANLALTAAMTPRRVLLIDADLHTPTLHTLFKLPRVPGLTDVLGSFQRARTEEPFRFDGRWLEGVMTCFAVGAGALDVLSAGSTVQRTADRLGSVEMQAMIRWMVDSYDLVLFDSPPVLGLPDAQALAALMWVDTVMTIGARQRQRRLRRSLRQLELTGVNLLGVIMNRGGEQRLYGR